jgi:hypothetical protein
MFFHISSGLSRQKAFTAAYIKHKIIAVAEPSTISAAKNMAAIRNIVLCFII